MAKNIVVCCDSADNPFFSGNTNVLKLFGILDFDQRDRQIGYYNPGYDEPAPAQSLVEPFVDILLGRGIEKSLSAAYQFLTEKYEPRDRIFLFGVGVGGFIASGLGNLLQLVGLLRTENRAAIRTVLELMREPPERASFLAERFKAIFPRECSPYFLGVWDTLAGSWPWRDPIHLTYAAGIPDLPIGRHAIAIDEPRALFHENLWLPPTQGQDLKQVWFAGAHSDVAGGYPAKESGLSNIALEWMIREAMLAGLLVNDDHVEIALGAPDEFIAPDATALQHDPRGIASYLFEFFPFRIFDPSANPPKTRWRVRFGRGREIPESAAVHDSVRVRRDTSTYRPKNWPETFEIEPWARWQRRPTEATASSPQPQTAIAFPEGLLDEIRGGRCVLYAGAGMSATAGLPVWRVFAEQLVDQAERSHLIEESVLRFYRAALRDGKTDYAVDAIVARMPQEQLLPFLRATFLRSGRLPAVYSELSKLPFAAMLTTNFDNLLALAFKDAPVRTPQDSQALLNGLTRSERFVLNLYGTLERPETLLVSPAQFEEAISENLPFREFMENLFVSRTILFVGCLEGIQTYLQGLRFKGASSRRHYAIAGVLGTSWEVMAGVSRTVTASRSFPIPTAAPRN